MRVPFRLAAVAACAIAVTVSAAYAASVQRAAAVVNGIVISTFDLDQRSRMILSTSGGAAGAAAMQRIREQVLRTLIDEILQLAEARKMEISVTEAQIDESLSKIAQQNGTTPDAIVRSLAAAGIYPDTLRTQIAAEVAWSQVIEARIAPRINISDEAIDAEMKRIQDGASKPQYYISEIFIGADSPGDDARARRAIEQIMAQIQAGTPFPALAEQFSESASAGRGGDMGWVQDGDVAPEIWSTLQAMQVQTISRPIRTSAGWYLIALRDKMRPAGSAQEVAPAPPGRPPGVPAGSVKLKRVVLGLPPQMTKQQEERYLQAAGGLRQQIKGCQGLDEFSKQIQGVFVMDLPVLPIRDLAPEIQRAIQGLNPSDVSVPFFTREGDQNLLNMLVVCGDRPRVDFVATKVFEMPSRDQIANRMFSQEVSVAARRLMRDLRRDASIEIRDPALMNQSASN